MADTSAVGVDTAAAVADAVVVLETSAAVGAVALAVVVLETSAAVGVDTAVAAAVAWRGRKEEDEWRRDQQQHCQHCRCCCVGGDSETTNIY